MNMGCEIEEAEFPPVPPDAPVTFHDGRQLNPYWCWAQGGTIKYNTEIQLAPVADMGLLTQEF